MKPAVSDIVTYVRWSGGGSDVTGGRIEGSDGRARRVQALAAKRERVGTRARVHRDALYIPAAAGRRARVSVRVREGEKALAGSIDIDIDSHTGASLLYYTIIQQLEGKREEIACRSPLLYQAIRLSGDQAIRR